MCCFQQPWRRSGCEEAVAGRSFSAAVEVEDFKVEIKRTSKSSSLPSSLEFLGLNDLFASDLCFAHTRIWGKQYLISLPNFPYKIVERSVFILQRLASTQARKMKIPPLGRDLDRLCYDQKTRRAHGQRPYQMQTWDGEGDWLSVGTLSSLWWTALHIAALGQNETLYLCGRGLTLLLSS